MATASASRWVTTYASDDSLLKVEALDGLAWSEVPKPRRRHRCWAQTRGFSLFSGWIEYCPCGGVRAGSRHWFEKNSRAPS